MNTTLESIDQFLQYLRAHDRATNTIQGYRSDLTNFAVWFEETVDEVFSPRLVTSSDIRAYREHLLTDRRLQPTTINRKLAALSAMLNWAQATGQINYHPGRQVKPLAVDKRSPRWLDKKEQRQLLRAVERDLQMAYLRYPKRWLTRQRDASLVVVLLNTGLRLHEALQLRMTDVAINDRSGHLTVRRKGHPSRTIPLNNPARQALQAWLAVYPSDNQEFVWIAVECAREGSLSSRSVERLVGRYGKLAGLANLTPHVLRHTFAKNLVAQGADLEQVATLLGHSGLNTIRVYTTPSQVTPTAAGWAGITHPALQKQHLTASRTRRRTSTRKKKPLAVTRQPLKQWVLSIPVWIKTKFPRRSIPKEST